MTDTITIHAVRFQPFQGGGTYRVGPFESDIEAEQWMAMVNSQRPWLPDVAEVFTITATDERQARGFRNALAGPENWT